MSTNPITIGILGRSLTTLTQFCLLLTIFLPPVDICDGIPLILQQGKICLQLTYSVPPTHLVLSTQLNNDPYKEISEDIQVKAHTQPAK